MFSLNRVRSSLLGAALFLLSATGAHAITTQSDAHVSAALYSATNIAPPPVSNPYQGLWYNLNESGWGVSITQHLDTIFAVWYTYDQAGVPVWYVMPNCSMYGKDCTSDLYKVTGATPPSLPWNGASKAVTKVGVGTLSFFDADHSLLTYTLDGMTGSKIIIRQIFAGGVTAPPIDYSDLWWNPAESGWGVALTHQFGVIFAAWFTYDAAGKPIWYVASNCEMSVKSCNGDLYEVSGGVAPNKAWNPTAINATKVGMVNFTFSDSDNAIMDYTIKGTPGSRAIRRQAF